MHNMMVNAQQKLNSCITRFKPLVAALDAIYKDKEDLDAKCIRDILLTPDIILMLLLLAELLVPINNFCKFLQMRNLNYSLVMTKYQRVVSKLESIKTELPNHSSIDTNLKHFKFASIFSTLKKPCPSQGNFDHRTQNLHPLMEKLISSLEVWVRK